MMWALARKLRCALLLWVACPPFAGTDADKLDVLLSNAMFERSSVQCNGGGPRVTSFNTTFVPSNSSSNWDAMNTRFESDAFDVEMAHADPTSRNRSWIMRIGKGGQIMSFRAAFGEAIANQASAYAAWNDLVIQPVSINTAYHETIRDGTYYPYFIHGSGPYMRQCVGIPANVPVPAPDRSGSYYFPNNRTCAYEDGMPPPFYNPKLAQDCGTNGGGDTCAGIHWGNQAHLKTIFRSDVLYYSKYKDCGGGIIEYDIIIHNYSDDVNDMLTYLNTPWSGLRTSSLKDMMIASKKSTTPVLERIFPLLHWGGEVRNLKDTGGFTTFAQDIRLSSDAFDFGFCVDLNATTPDDDVADVDCQVDGSIALELKVQENNTAKYSGSHSSEGVYAVWMNLCNLRAPVRRGSYQPHGLIFTNSRTGFNVSVGTAIHWCWNGKYTFFTSSVNETVLNDEFMKDDQILVAYNVDGLSMEDNLAFTFVHGTNPESDVSTNDWYRGNSRMRYGVTDQRRDGTVWTTNFIGTLNPSQTYFNRKYMITDRLMEMENRSTPFVGDTHEDVLDVEELPVGDVIRLLYGESAFGAALEGEECASLREACVGSSTPKLGAKPVFYITCGSNNTYVGSDTYALSPNDGTFFRPYLCGDQPTTVRPTYKLLGFFPKGSCRAIMHLTYEQDLVTNACPAYLMPTDAPTTTTTTTTTDTVTAESPMISPTETPVVVSTTTTESPTASSVSASNSPTNLPPINSLTVPTVVHPSKDSPMEATTIDSHSVSPTKSPTTSSRHNDPSMEASSNNSPTSDSSIAASPTDFPTTDSSRTAIPADSSSTTTSPSAWPTTPTDGFPPMDSSSSSHTSMATRIPPGRFSLGGASPRLLTASSLLFWISICSVSILSWMM